MQRTDTISITRCEVCGSSELRDVLDLGNHPLCDDLVPVGDERVPVEYPISIAYCPTCKTAHQNYQVPKRTLFPESYHYRARHTADVLNGMRQLVEACQNQLGDLKGLKVLDVGCNDGSLLSIFAEKGAVTFGIEPTGAAADAKGAAHTVYNDYLTPSLAARFVEEHGQPDIVTFTNVFAHIEDLSSVLASVKTLMSDKTLLVIENHYLGAVLERHQFDTFYHEHPRTYSLTSFKFIADTLGAKIDLCEFPARYGGNIRIMMQAGSGSATCDLTQHLAREETFEQELVELARRIPLWKKAKRNELDKMIAEHGPLPGKAFPGRAAILVKLLDLDEKAVSAVYEKPTSMKVGHYLPGTRIPILSDDEFADRSAKDAPLLNLAWHISTEIHGYMRKQGFDGTIVDILTQEEMDRLE
ncbi:class I SAM-dependent methyltransferase [Mesorhizobium sp. ZC-5]|uniref:class I SAM-dependent methyltransferase n=1 Tax=Mesorhizobium sp. ZC-5 TaxID=2986066 RepID=UPI0021E82103|nr:class I SAM-dependent methyltransferase [Mesorhizobium sp. ZC-5]MCV3243692.1 class I SAM-dependent methyltransferase [Mesorhizobium sp. ZC-5]